MGTTVLQLGYPGITGRINLLLDSHDGAVHLVVFIKQPAEMGVVRLELMDGVAQFRELQDERMVKVECLCHNRLGFK